MADPVTLAVLTGVSTAISAGSTIAGGKAAMSDAEFNAAQFERAAGESRASSQREALERRRNTELLQSELQAKAAASGGGATDPTILGLTGDIAERGELQALTEMFKGESRARGLEDQASATRARGKAAKKASRLKALGTIIGGASSMFGKFGSVTPAGTTVSSDPWAGLRKPSYG